MESRDISDTPGVHGPTRQGSPAKWCVLNQSISPAFMGLVEALSVRLGPVLLVTGTEVGPVGGQVQVEKRTAYDRKGLMARAYSWARFGLDATRVVVGKPYIKGVFLVVTNPPFLPNLVWLLRRKYVVLVWDLYPQHLVAAGIMSAHNPLVRLWARLNRRVFLDADTVVTLGEGMARAIRASLGGEAGRCQIEVIPNFVDTAAVHPVVKSQNGFALLHDQVGVLTVMYAGNMGLTHGLHAVIEAAARIQHIGGVRFVLVGNGLGRAALQADVERRKLGNVTVLDPVPWDDVPEMLAAADIAVVAQARGSEDYSVPSKVVSSLAAGSALIALTSDSSDLASLVRDNGVGVVHESDDGAGVAASILKFIACPQELQDCRHRARRLAEREFSIDSALTRFLSVFDVPATSEESLSRSR